MKAMVMTDMEGVAGVMSFDGYTTPDGPYYEAGRELATLEASAAIQGLLDAGATEILVVDGHGPGALTPMLLHPRARLLAGRPITYPFGLDGTFDAMVMVGQHAKAGTEAAHLCHTMDRLQIDCTLNGVSMGECGLNMATAGLMRIPCILVAGDKACCDEARALVPEIEIAPVKEGLNQGAAIHMHPDQARGLIRDRAWKAACRLAEIPPLHLVPPYIMTGKRAAPDGDKVVEKIVEGDDLLDVFRRFWG